jgi:hypothetical protein
MNPPPDLNGKPEPAPEADPQALLPFQVLPARSFSYELQRRLVKAAVQNPFLESVQTIADLTGVAVSKRS